MSLTEDRESSTLRSLNDKFWARTLQPEASYRSLDHLGYDIDHCVVFELYPDSGSAFVLRMMNHERQLQELDIDLDDPSASIVEGIDSSHFRKRQGSIKLSVIKMLFEERQSAT